MKEFQPSPGNASLVLAAHLSILAATVAVYAGVTSLDFVDFDDFLYVVDNEWASRGLAVDGVRRAFTETIGGYFAPVLWISFMLDITLFGTGPSGHHVMNVVFHALNAMLVLELLRRGTGHLGAAWGVALCFALHPVQVESVAWVTERKNVLSMLLGLVSIGAYASWTRHRAPTSYALSLLAAAASLLTKATFVTLPFLLLLVDVWPLRRLQASLRPDGMRRRIGEKLPFFALALAAAAGTYLAQQASGAVAGFTNLGFVLRVENAIVSYVRYLGLLAWPHDLAALYPYPSLLGHDMWGTGQVVAALGCLAIVTVVAVLRRARSPEVLVGWLWYLGALVPMIGLIQAGDQSLADRHLYLPVLGVLVALFYGLRPACERWIMAVRPRKVLAGALAGLALMSLGWRSADQVATWRDTLTLFEHAAAVTDENWIALNNAAWLRATCPDPALRDSERAVELAEEACRITRRGEPEMLDTLAVAYANAGRWREASATAREALQLTIARGDRAAQARMVERQRGIERRRAVRSERGCQRPSVGPSGDRSSENRQRIQGVADGSAQVLLKRERLPAEGFPRRTFQGVRLNDGRESSSYRPVSAECPGRMVVERPGGSPDARG